MPTLTEISPIMETAKQAAIDYYKFTGKPLGITGELGEYFAAKFLNLKLADARTPGYDAVDQNGNMIQVKSRVIPDINKLSGQRTGSIRLDHQWDMVVLVLMNQFLELQAIHEAEREPISNALSAPGSKARNERVALAIPKFISIGREVWSKNGK